MTYARFAPSDPLAAQLRDPVAQRANGPKPLGAAKAKARGTTRVKVGIVRRGIALLDVDNLYGGVKALLDALRYEGVIADDNAKSIELEVRQEKVKRAQMGTLITITPIL